MHAARLIAAGSSPTCSFTRLGRLSFALATLAAQRRAHAPRMTLVPRCHSPLCPSPFPPRRTTCPALPFATLLPPHLSVLLYPCRPTRAACLDRGIPFLLPCLATTHPTTTGSRARQRARCALQLHFRGLRVHAHVFSRTFARTRLHT